MPGATHPKKKAKVDGVDDAEASGVGTRMIFGRVARDWTVDENQFIYDHLAGKKRARPSKSKPATSKAVKDKSKGEDDEAEGAVNESS
ncbi:uncharacterized protein PSFLO_04043 [Pseudozyma flocculosa]|uniref:Uncharacterized protein n=1 Tax=Pseudozyma flocculosa TaxID=84751 RepID=A0A5C3F3K9_9BASI|nr:uncharacterized protein PSFLO_04043 [Pseudozyma flocculosa]